MRASSATRPSSSGTLKSTRTSTRSPSATGRSRTLRFPSLPWPAVTSCTSYATGAPASTRSASSTTRLE
jgi:hypothetical protein